MQRILHILVDEVNSRGHLSSLLNGVKMSVMLDSNSGVNVLIIENGKLGMEEEADQEIDAYISGKEAIMKELLMGRIKLRAARKNGHLQLKSTIRNSLFLESLFFLALTSGNHTEISKLLVDEKSVSC